MSAIEHSKRQWVGCCALGCIAGALACQDILGIQPLTENPRSVTADAGSGGSGGAGGETASNGGGSAGTSGAVPGGGGSAGSGTGLGLGGSPVAVSPDAGAPDAGAGGVVTGRVIDFLRRPVPDQPVTIGDTTVVTNAQGRFTIAGVEAPYTASLMVTSIRSGGQSHYGYVYEGLTRNDPTLQVYSGLVERSASSLLVSFDSVTFDEGRFAVVAFESPDGRFSDEETTSNTEFLGSPLWSGPSTITGNIHALLSWRDVPSEPPVAYEAYQTLPLTAVNSQQASVTFDLPFDPELVTGIIAGSATGGAFEPRSHYVALRAADGAVLPLVDATTIADDFAYFVPQLPGSSFVVGAADGSFSFPPFAVAHRENVAFNSSEVALAVPRPVTLQSPQLGANVTPSTTYSWSNLSQTAQTYLWHLEFDATYEGIFVLTSRTEIELPEFADGFSVPQGVAVTWSVETHGDAPNIDALTGPDGYMDAFSLGTPYPVGPNRNDGYYAESERRSFTMGSD